MAPRKKNDTVMTRDQAQKLINEKLVIARNAITEAEALGDEHQVGFEFSVAYGMGGYYRPRRQADPVVAAALQKLTDEELNAMGHTRKDWEPGGRHNYSDEEDGWRSSSQSC